uniref:Uncharacterized protein n=1 Tax=Arundo donax TaxID=35708 RepID=A0A0A9BV70_ARUDO
MLSSIQGQTQQRYHVHKASLAC